MADSSFEVAGTGLNASFAVITGTFSNGTANDNYPTGFNQNNCTVISFMVNSGGNSGWRGIGEGIAGSQTGQRCYATLYPDVVHCESNQSSYSTASYIIVLMKIS